MDWNVTAEFAALPIARWLARRRGRHRRAARSRSRICPSLSMRPRMRAVERIESWLARSMKFRMRPSACTHSMAPTAAVVFGSSMRLAASRNGISFADPVAVHSDDPVRRHRRFREHDVEHGAHTRRATRQQQHVAVVMPHHFAQIGEHAAQHGVRPRGRSAAHRRRSRRPRPEPGRAGGLRRCCRDDAPAARRGPRRARASRRGCRRSCPRNTSSRAAPLVPLVRLQHGQADRLQHLAHEHPPRLSLLLRLAAQILAERAGQQSRAGRPLRRLQRTLQRRARPPSRSPAAARRLRPP